MLVAVFQNRILEALRLAGPGPGGDQRGPAIIAGQALKRRLLVDIGKVGGMDGLKAGRLLLRDTEWKPHGNIRFMLNRVLCLQQLSHRTLEGRVCHRERGFDVVPDAFL